MQDVYGVCDGFRPEEQLFIIGHYCASVSDDCAHVLRKEKCSKAQLFNTCTISLLMVNLLHMLSVNLAQRLVSH